ncbi:MAG: nucleoside triphosphate pyrophosphohydrolase [Verrucomicrobiota bacterium]
MSDIARLREIVARLRAPDGCPWDREQTHESLRAALVEECYEVIEAIEKADDANLREELGDLLLHVVLHAHMAAERNAFSFEEVVGEICEKLVRRHPHVFADARTGNATEVLRQWEQIKREEKSERTSIMDGLPAALPALLRAQNVQIKASRVGFDWKEASAVFAKVDEEVAELREAVALGKNPAIEEELGDLLFTVVNLARKLHVDGETALTLATKKFTRRFRAVEAEIIAQGRKIEAATPEEMNALWDKHKADAA